MDKAEAIRRLQAMPCPAPNQLFEVDSFRPEDAWGVARLFYEVYGAAYPFDRYYIPEQLIAAHAAGELFPCVARAESGDILGQMALFRSSAPFARLLENGLGLVLPDYRTSFAAFRLFKYTVEALPTIARMDAMFGEGVCHHLTVQKMIRIGDLRVAGLELDLMPAVTYAKEAALVSRVACLVGFKSLKDRPQRVYIPEAYREAVDFLLADLDIERELAAAEQPLPATVATRAQERYFDFAQVGRCTFMELGGDFAATAAAVEARAVAKGVQALQFFLDLSEPSVGQAVETLRARGFFLSGYLPRWNDNDALLLQKLWSQPDFEAVKLYDEKAKALMALVRVDWERAQGCA